MKFCYLSLSRTIPVQHICYVPSKAKRTLERLGIQTSSPSVFLILKPISYFLAFIWLGFLYRDLSILPKSYLIEVFKDKLKTFHG